MDPSSLSRQASCLPAPLAPPPDVFVDPVLSVHSAGVMFSTPSSPSQATIDHFYDLIPLAVCCCQSRFDPLSVCYCPVDVFMSPSAAHMPPCTPYFQHTRNILNSVCVLSCARACIANPKAISHSICTCRDPARERGVIFFPGSLNPAETASLPHKYFRSSVFKV